ncbi:protein POLAR LOCALIZATION DURING ASYMMETRIC DIVISION AND REDISTRIBUTION-like isoform X2 [Momordica charantia]|nr:protein POLAR LOCALIZATION DURING ASYMMETRIC DIVISION AND REDISTRIBUTION-like isoform X2 [Momordica charantia]
MKSPFKSPNFSESCNSTGRLLRVVDILLEEEDDGAGCDGDFGMSDAGERLPDESPTLQCLSPRRIIARWVASFRRLKRRREAEEVKRVKEGGESDGRLTPSRCSRNGVDGGASSSSPTESAGPGLSRKEDTSFNLGVGCSLLYLVLASRNELSKMADLRRQMELFLQDIKEELRRKGDPFEPFQLNTDLACSSTDCQEGPCSTSQLSYQQDFSSQILSDAQSTIPNHSWKSCPHEQGECQERIDELESEFEAELERLQIHLEVESSSGRIEQLRIKTAKNASSTRSCRWSSSEVIDPQEDGTEGQHGVPPIELERKLHELLETRQQERIKELEGALECAKQELTDKESEVSWWKETAKVISQHIPVHSRLRLASQHDQLQLLR